MSIPAAPPSAAGVRAAENASVDEVYYQGSRPDVRRHVPAAARRVLDVGCGAGSLGAALREERGAEVVGIELFPEAAEQAAERLDHVIVANLDDVTELPYPDGHFDAMTFGDVLEHLRAPDRLLRVLRRYLAPGGTIVCSIPNVKHWTVVFDLLVRDRWRYADSGLLDRTHVHFFTLTELGEMLQQTGFVVRGVESIEHAMPQEIASLPKFAALFGENEADVAVRLNAYQYLVTAQPAP
jgi:methionine biosynthesis protein MetW